MIDVDPCEVFDYYDISISSIWKNHCKDSRRDTRLPKQQNVGSSIGLCIPWQWWEGRWISTHRGTAALSFAFPRISFHYITRAIATLAKYQHKDGGFAGGPDHIPHMASTYAAVLALCTVGTVEAFDIIDRYCLMFVLLLRLTRCDHCSRKMYVFLKSMKRPSGAFGVHLNGEEDIRYYLHAYLRTLLS